MGIGCRPCGMKGKRPEGLTVGVFAASQPAPDVSTGRIELATHHECSEAYHGLYPSAAVHIVGWKTDQERFYRRGQRQEAIRDASKTHQSMITVPASSLCHETMVAFLGG